ncbi:HNH endonuclease [Ruminococcus albus]|uniref:A nuclease of the HNH/ENDO VII superfamily with conserved WHH n=1 Tax=Ruminococcus albus TaxID=1264 RepID=A0A1I1L0W3_RUMAL|nr:HNH endonuclease [Ruminococcus albus]SFC66699.1 A nuclease of the HNH/ENDO VII superfamily with conserved WHH [Ruminococcus albus]
MNLARKVKAGLSLFTASAMLFSFTGCELGKAKQESSTVSQAEVSKATNVDADVNDINDAFVELNIQPIVVNSVDTLEINVEDIVVNPVNVKGIQNIEVEVIPINDDFITVAHENFVSYYGEDIDLKKFFIDAAIGATAVVVMVTLTTVSGGTATFFGAVLVSEMSKAAVIIGAAIDAAVSGYQAYQEGGDASYIIGHMLNGVAEGFKWSAILAPLTGGISGIKALRAVKYLKKVPGLEQLEDKTARALIKNLAKIIKEAPENLSDDALKKAYKALSKEVTEEITEDIFMQVIKNESAIVSIVQKTDAFGAGKGVRQALQERFWKRAGVTDEVGKTIIKEIKQQSLKNLDDISEPAVKEYINKNMYEFVEYFGGSLSKDFVDSCLKNSISEEAYQAIKETITDEKAYLRLIEKLGTSQTDDILSDSSTLIMLQKRFGADNLANLRNGRAVFNQLSNTAGRTNVTINPDDVVKVMEDLFDGNIDNLAQIEKIDRNIAANLTASRDLISTTFKDMGLVKKSSSLFDDLSVKGLGYAGIDSSVANTIIGDGMTKQKIINDLGQSAYDSLLKNPDLTIQSLALKANVNESLIEEITTDALKSNGLSDDIIKQLIKGDSLGAAEQLTAKQLNDIGNIVADYYKYTDFSTYSNFNRQLAQARGENISAFLKEYQKDFTITNYKYAGNLMSPTGSNANYIKAKYGDIYMSKSGFAIFDDYAIARVKVSDLTGIDTSDIQKANRLHHGTSESIKGYTWHHLEDGETLILIPTELHDAYKHTGGASLIREGLKEAV